MVIYYLNHRVEILVTYSEDFSEWTFLGNTDINATNITVCPLSGENKCQLILRG